VIEGVVDTFATRWIGEAGLVGDLVGRRCGDHVVKMEVDFRQFFE
jgi:hypothetical protein